MVLANKRLALDGVIILVRWSKVNRFCLTFTICLQATDCLLFIHLLFNNYFHFALDFPS